ncbi:MAG TPA: hypothetical protein VK939_16955 [Longimicrobiales bacterium]|nr:hypothetical protein [Longimicrobiales bacterium]
MRALLPSWPLLLWSGLAATVTCVWILGALLPSAGARALVPGARGGPALPALGLGIFVYPLLYAVPFQLLHNASILLGAVLGTGHALVLALAGRRRDRPHWNIALQRALSVILYGALLGFVYVTP